VYNRLEQAKPKLTKKTIVLPIVGILAFFLYVFLFNIDFLTIITTAQRAQPVPYLLAILISFVEILFYALTWREILRNLKVALSLLKSYLFVWYAIFMDILVPAESVSGEVCRLYLMNREQCGTGGKVIASLVTYRLLSMFMNSAFLVVGAALLFGSTQINPIIFDIILLLVATIVVLIIILLIASWRENWSSRIINFIIRIGKIISRGKWELEKTRQYACNTAKIFHNSMKYIIRNPNKLVIPTFYLALNWITSMSIPYLVFLSLGTEVSWSAIFVTNSIVIAIKSVPVGIPFEVGLPEIAMTTLYAAVGIAPEIAATSTILSRIITLWIRFFFGFAAYQFTEIKILSSKTGSTSTDSQCPSNESVMKNSKNQFN